jgi:hypothetical protein
MLTTDEWGSYARELPKEKLLTGKLFTQRIERNNLTLRTRIKRLSRRTICFSRSVELHEKVIGAFIEKYMFYLSAVWWRQSNTSGRGCLTCLIRVWATSDRSVNCATNCGGKILASLQSERRVTSGTGI